MRLSPETKTVLIRLAAECSDREVCGLLDSAGEAYPIRNVSGRAGCAFVFHKADYYLALDHIARRGRDVAAIYHSHPGNDTQPSAEDLATAVRFDLPMVIVAGSEVVCHE